MSITVKIIEQEAEFFASGRPSLIQIHGKTNHHQETLNIVDDKLSGEVSVDLNTFHTGMKFRDRHLYSKVFNIEKFPVATLILQALSMAESDFTGTLQFHGIKKEIKGKQKFSKTNIDWNYQIEFKVDMSDFGIAPPDFLGMKMNPEVRVEVNGKIH